MAAHSGGFIDVCSEDYQPVVGDAARCVVCGQPHLLYFRGPNIRDPNIAVGYICPTTRRNFRLVEGFDLFVNGRYSSTSAVFKDWHFNGNDSR